MAEPTPTEVDELIRLLKGVNERARAVLLDEIKSLERSFGPSQNE
jgi:hypothetical protein